MTAEHSGGVPRAVVFDFGGVLIEWNPRHLFRKIFGPDEAAMERFLTHVCSATWNLMQDAGRTFDEGVAELSARFPDQAELIAAYHHRWDEMVPHDFADSVEVLEDLKAAGVPLYGITNFSVEKFALARRRFPFFRHFDGIVVSGEVRLIKPDPAIFLHFLERHGLAAAECVFIDDSPVNVAAARRLGFHGVDFTGAADLRDRLNAWGVLAPAPA